MRGSGDATPPPRRRRTRESEVAATAGGECLPVLLHTSLPATKVSVSCVQLLSSVLSPLKPSSLRRRVGSVAGDAISTRVGSVQRVALTCKDKRTTLAFWEIKVNVFWASLPSPAHWSSICQTVRWISQWEQSGGEEEGGGPASRGKSRDFPRSIVFFTNPCRRSSASLIRKMRMFAFLPFDFSKIR